MPMQWEINIIIPMNRIITNEINYKTIELKNLKISLILIERYPVYNRKIT